MDHRLGMGESHLHRNVGVPSTGTETHRSTEGAAGRGTHHHLHCWDPTPHKARPTPASPPPT